DPTGLDPGDAWVDVAGLLANLGSPSVNTSPLVVTHHTGAAGSPGGVDTPYTDADLASGPFANQFVVSAYNVDGLINGLVPSLPALDPNQFDPAKLNLKAGLNTFLDTLQSLLDGPILGKSLPLLGDKIKNALDFVQKLRDAANQLGPDSAIDAVKDVLIK